jgi:glyoxylase-like metal-dependent hydrolase (beta-lactamase superfamily II)
MTDMCDRGYDELPEGLHLFDLPQPRTGFRRFISSWFFVDEMGRRILVDPGPASTIPLLLDKLSNVTDGVDVILLTHIHLDHSGGIGQFCKRFGDVLVIAHPKAARHLVDPGKLWRSSLEVLGDVAEMYGEPSPLDSSLLAGYDGVPGIGVIETPGHAPHHISFIVPFGDKRLFFIGEAGGVYHKIESPSGEPYMRPATPAKFDVDAARSSITKIAQAIQGDDLFCYAHWGISERPLEMISKSRAQLDEWMSSISEMKEQPEDVIIDRLFSKDPFLGEFSALPTDIRECELVFIKNSVRGILRYFGG